MVVDEVTVYNPCNPAFTSCRDFSHTPPKSLTVKTEDNWGYVFKAGVSYAAGASASLMGFGASEPITISAEVPQPNGGSYEKDLTLSATQSCVAKPMTRVTCNYKAFKGTIEVGYKVYWKNALARATRGTYKGQGWKIVMSTQTYAL